LDIFLVALSKGFPHKNSSSLSTFPSLSKVDDECLEVKGCNLYDPLLFVLSLHHQESQAFERTWRIKVNSGLDYRNISLRIKRLKVRDDRRMDSWNVFPLLCDPVAAKHILDHRETLKEKIIDSSRIEKG